MKIHDRTITFYGSILGTGDDRADDAFADWVAEALTEAAEAAALDVLDRIRTGWPRWIEGRDIYATVDGERVAAEPRTYAGGEPCNRTRLPHGAHGYCPGWAGAAPAASDGGDF
jgi:hypothetical protein